MKIDRLLALNKYGSRCAYCGEPITPRQMQVDHIKPKRLGGTDDFDNLNPACGPCNNRKMILSVDEFRNEISAQVSRLRRDSGAFRLAERFGLIQTTGNCVVFYFERLEANELD